MATDLIMPTLNDQHPAQFHAQFYSPQQRPLQHQRSQSYQAPPAASSSSASYGHISPLSTSNTSPVVANNSNSNYSTPTSPRARDSRKKFDGFGYIPAVLRPTEYPSKPIAAAKGNQSENSTPFGSLRRSSNSFISLAAGFAAQRLTRRSTGDSGKSFAEGEIDIELFPDVTAEPTRKHWKPDPQSTVCDDPTCKRTFSYFTRRHHCRRCGNIFCDMHSAFSVPLDQDANFNPRGSAFRACGHCFLQFQVWKSRNNSQASSSASSDGAATAANPATPVAAIPSGLPGPGATKSPDVASSVPRDWNWSTF